MDLPIDYEKSHWTVRKLAREEYTRQQEGKCYHCGESLDGNPSKEILVKEIDRRRFPQNFFRHRVHLHHCRKTGMSIGTVHSLCNAVLWQYHGE